VGSLTRGRAAAGWQRNDGEERRRLELGVSMEESEWRLGMEGKWCEGGWGLCSPFIGGSGGGQRGGGYWSGNGRCYGL
jgi:hypothetical protein